MSKREFRPGQPIRTDYPAADDEMPDPADPPVRPRSGVPRLPERGRLEQPEGPFTRLVRWLFRRR